MATSDAAVAAAGAAPRLRLHPTQARALGERLAMNPRDRHLATTLAAALGVSPSWLRTQRRRAEAGTPVRRPGRPRKTDEERAQVRALVTEARAMRGAGTGGKTIHRALEPSHPGLSRMLVEQEVAAQKRDARAERQRAIDEAREGVEVLGRDTVWGEDTAHNGRLRDGSESTRELIRDRATLATVSLAVGPPPTADDVLAGLRRAALERGGWPLVIQVDNASIYLAALVQRELAAQRVVVLRSRVHTPTDNGATERGHAEFKAETGLGKGVVLSGHAEAEERLARARACLDEGRPRASRGDCTAAVLDQIVPRADAVVDRDRFYAHARAAMQTAVLGIEDKDAARLAEREAIFTTLCEFGLAKRHVGLRPRRGSIPMPEPRPASGAARQAG